ncbi:MAG: hypothetical protein ACWA40_07435 [Planktomarina sp.]
MDEDFEEYIDYARAAYFEDGDHKGAAHILRNCATWMLKVADRVEAEGAALKQNTGEAV